MFQQTSGPFPGYCLGGSSSILPGTPAYGLGGSAVSVGASAASVYANPYQPGPSPYAQAGAAMYGANPQGFAPNASGQYAGTQGQPPIVNPVLGGSFSAPVGAPIGGSGMCRALGGSFSAPPGGMNGVPPQISYQAPPYYVGLPPQLGGSMSALPGAPTGYGQPGATSYPGTFSTSALAGMPQIQNGTPGPYGANPPSASATFYPGVSGAPVVPGAPDAARAAGIQGSQYPDAPHVITEAEFQEYEMLRAMAYGGENGGQVQPMVARRTKTACC